MTSPESSTDEMILSFLAEGGDDFISGAVLSDKLGLSRAAVWKHVDQLRRLGYRIEAQASRGYRLVEVPDRLTGLELAPLLSTSDIGRTVHFFESLASTNTTAFELAREGAFHGDVVIAEAQTQGKGRRGRGWASTPGKNLTCSVVLRPEVAPQRAAELTLLGAVALAETLVEAGVPALIKWPNDVLVNGRKVAGVLTELSADVERVQFVVLGVGVNLNAAKADWPPDVAEAATSVMLERGAPVPRALFAAALFTRLERWLERWSNEGFEPLRAAWKARSATLGHEVLVREERRELRGMAEDIDDTGALLVRVGTQVERVLAADVEHLRTKKS